MSTLTSTERNGGGAGSASVLSATESVPVGNGQTNGNGDETTPAHSRRPADVALKQQRMRSWQPLLDPKWVIACYLFIGIVFIPTGE